VSRQPKRRPEGGRIHRDEPLEFTFNGKRYQGYRGDTIASALLANDVHRVGRSWKYHRPRGIIGSGAEEPNAIFQVGVGARTVPNQRGTQTELYDGLVARSVSGWPSLGFDLMAASGFFSRLMPAGFYYKTFMWPASMWMQYEHLIRKASGLGTSPDAPDPDTYVKRNAHCDVLVVGAGPVGLSAALAAGRSGARVIIADEQSEPGGSLLDGRERIDGVAATDWVAGTVAELERLPEVRLISRGTVFGYHDHNFLTIAERLTDHLPEPERQGQPRERLWRVRAKQVVLASGAIERPLVFANNDRPGIMLASSVSSYINRYAVVPGSRAVLFTNNDGAYQTALDLAGAGVEVAAVVDARSGPGGALPARVREAGIEILSGSVIVDTKGGKRIQGVQAMALNPAGDTVQGAARALACDLLALSGGWSPVVHLHAQSGGKPRFDQALACFVPGKSVQAERSAGAANGAFRLGACLAEGASSGAASARAAGFGDGAVTATPVTEDVAEEPLLPLWLAPSPRPAGRGSKQFVDMQNDTTAADIILAAREGYRSVEHVKRYTAMGFGTDQGKLGNINGMAILARALGNDIPSTGTTTFRPNYTPVTFGAIAGADLGGLLFEPVRKTALHPWHEARGAAFEDVGQWKRPWYYPRPGESMQDAVNRECLAARNGVGILDASTLGKIDIQGPDAAEFLNRVYTNAWKKLGVGRCRYGLMLGEDGMVMDDGVSVRLGEQHFFMHTTTGGAARVMAWLERWLQTEWPTLKVYLTSVTDHWATAAVVGPKSREVVSRVCEGIDFSPEAFPFMSSREGAAAGIPARVNRISFSGELAYEVNVAADFGRHVWEALMQAGEPDGITPYGTETMHVLRAEKGYVIVGQDTDGSVTPGDLGMDKLVAKTKDCLGKRSLSRPDAVRTDRKQLVGLLSEVPEEVLPEGGQIVADPAAPIPTPMLGHVTSSYFSACLGRSIALALIKGGFSRIGESVHVPLADGRTLAARIASPVFYDPEGARQHV
jgi:sarcosine oxidase subunit alpha